jgi:hypothetical protein
MKLNRKILLSTILFMGTTFGATTANETSAVDQNESPIKSESNSKLLETIKNLETVKQKFVSIAKDIALKSARAGGLSSDEIQFPQGKDNQVLKVMTKGLNNLIKQKEKLAEELGEKTSALQTIKDEKQNLVNEKTNLESKVTDLQTTITVTQGTLEAKAKEEKEALEKVNAIIASAVILPETANQGEQEVSDKPALLASLGTLAAILANLQDKFNEVSRQKEGLIERQKALDAEVIAILDKVQAKAKSDLEELENFDYDQM